MRWRQFFTPVENLSTDKAKKYIADLPPDDLVILDVRQPSEYQESHIPGATLIPLPELSDRLGEIDPEKPTLVY